MRQQFAMQTARAGQRFAKQIARAKCGLAEPNETSSLGLAKQTARARQRFARGGGPSQIARGKPWIGDDTPRANRLPANNSAKRGDGIGDN